APQPVPPTEPQPVPPTEPLPIPPTEPQPPTPIPPPQPPAPQPPPVPVPGPGTGIPLEPTWASINANVIAPKCVMCHSGAMPKGDIDLTSYDSIAKKTDTDPDTELLWKGDSSKSLLYLVVVVPENEEFAEMPPRKAIKAGKVLAVTTEEREAIKTWIDAGALP
ncbi:MAG: c-type cytochrome domain-containing protein, partial [Bdellovibrionota bacterium]